ncbi:FecR family protein [Roseofilum casamattae]|uniref:FecR protein domain-containing protein n=1 Tax=Roseofilum casamattae BLCC-M143 TaxID=3022442 RepID=A0ABT7BRZ7_9CYAN|nr:hypothetical protein [Roseofilum casamattae]MDJ1181964.1 hypothetical protein [Roseofilum casamattae BLCC-M143]
MTRYFNPDRVKPLNYVTRWGISLALLAPSFLAEASYASSPEESLEPATAKSTQIQLKAGESLSWTSGGLAQALSPPDAFAPDVYLAQSALGRSLTIEEIKGTVLLNGQPARVGDQLTSADDEIVTGDRSTVRLRIDSQIGVVELAPRTTFRVDTLSGGDRPISGFYIPLGRARFSISKFVTDPDRLLGREDYPIASLTAKQLEREQLLAQTATETAPVRVRTPAGVAGVRGTSFGVNVGPTGKTGITTLDGVVGVFSQGTEVLVNPGFYAVINPGEPPTVEKITPELSILRLRAIARAGAGVRIVGRADPMDLVYVNGREVPTDPDGKFSIVVRSGDRVRITLRGPSVRERRYNFSVNLSD